jgi:hypothetical protein
LIEERRESVSSGYAEHAAVPTHDERIDQRSVASLIALVFGAKR